MVFICCPEYPIYTRDWLKCIRTCLYYGSKSICAAGAEICQGYEYELSVENVLDRVGGHRSLSGRRFGEVISFVQLVVSSETIFAWDPTQKSNVCSLV